MPESRRQNPDAMAMASLVHIDLENIRFRRHWSIADPKLLVLFAFIDIGLRLCLSVCVFVSIAGIMSVSTSVSLSAGTSVSTFVCMSCHFYTHFDTHL